MYRIKEGEGLEDVHHMIRGTKYVTCISYTHNLDYTLTHGDVCATYHVRKSSRPSPSPFANGSKVTLIIICGGIRPGIKDSGGGVNHCRMPSYNVLNYARIFISMVETHSKAMKALDNFPESAYKTVTRYIPGSNNPNHHNVRWPKYLVTICNQS